MATAQKKLIGILGGIGSGKSSVAGEFAKLGCRVIDADKIAHQFLAEKEVIEQLVKAFGKNIVDENGKIMRKKLAEIVFADKVKNARINSIIHPLVDDRCRELIAEYNEIDQVKAIVLDVPLLAEVGWAERCDVLVFVECDEEIRYRRALQRGMNNLESIKKRENLQISLDNKSDISHYIVHNNSEMSAVAEQVKRVFSIILNTNQV
ncbi:MAG: dephospho-CoA kinase [Anaerohalosphaera sp.]|nr:dephospho-CoA kinase [Anaerohalosphaera sp.]